MDFNATIDLIIKDLREAGEIIDDLKRYPGVPLLQVELAKAKCRSAGEVISLLKNTEDLSSVVRSQPVAEPVKTNTREREVNKTAFVAEPEAPAAEEPKLTATSAKNEVPQSTETEWTDVVGKPPVRTIPADKIPAPSVKNDKPAEKPADQTILADKFSAPAGIYDKPSDNTEGDDEIPGLLNMKPLASLSDAIGLNDKFLFIGQIFNGNKEEYSKIITRLDNAGSIADAREIILGYSGNNPENEAVKRLLSLVKRKFPSNE